MTGIGLFGAAQVAETTRIIGESAGGPSPQIVGQGVGARVQVPGRKAGGVEVEEAEYPGLGRSITDEQGVGIHDEHPIVATGLTPTLDLGAVVAASHIGPVLVGLPAPSVSGQHSLVLAHQTRRLSVEGLEEVERFPTPPTVPLPLREGPFDRIT